MSFLGQIFVLFIGTRLLFRSPLFFRDATILSKVMTAIVFNSVPMEDIEDKEQGGTNNDVSRTKTLIREMMRYGVRDLFAPEELVLGKNIRHVTHCIDELRKMAEKDPGSILPTSAAAPQESH